MIIAGGGPAGLATAIRAAQRGLRTLLFERSESAPDKACGEGLMPSGARELEKLGARVEESAPFHGIRYLQEDGSSVEARFRGGAGLGIRRTVLAKALRKRARESGAVLQRGTVESARAESDRIEVSTDQGAVQGRLLVAADGLHSALRRAARLEGAPDRAPARYGIRRHFSLEPWSDLVEVYWSAGVEAYVTPVGPRCVNVALLCQQGGDFDELLASFPGLQARLAGAPHASETRGAGPLLQRARARHAQRLALIGDAAGYVDAITGQGLSLAFAASALLFEALPRDLAQDLAPALRNYDRQVQSKWLRYALPAHALVALSRRPGLRRAAIRSAGALPGAFAALLGVVG